ncbi:hypothetical protein BS50DRAFT_652678 [Corynespora cassiicola Philippines]|uniref:DUF7605 domain-containing protein n=1 Tax=Corynespora cassiicola Philippines TaxID=1448308 RepID=A0A2T2N6L4_CORCC|nr:hypothetical protein BS50DRAFT_652678 [Corynespora cassiicola Philippines]
MPRYKGRFKDTCPATADARPEEKKLQMANDSKSSTIPLKRSASPLNSNRQRPQNEQDDDEKIPAYNAESEPQPLLPMYHPEVAEIERAGVNLIEKFEDFLTKHSYQGEEAQYFLQFLNSYRKPSFEYSQIRFVLIGRSGVGKSSLLNTLLGYEGLSVYQQKLTVIKGAGGKSVTYVIQEYHYATPNQLAPLQAEVEFYPRSVWKEKVIKHIGDFWIFLQKRGKRASNTNCTMEEEIVEVELEESDDEEEEADDDKMDEINKLANTAVAVFCALFQNHPEFSTRNAAWRFLETINSKDDPIVTQKLLGWTEDIHAEIFQNKAIDMTKTFGAAHAAQLNGDIRPFISNVENPGIKGTKLRCCLWPFVKAVRYSLSSRALEPGNIIVDCPGVTDIDLSRVDETRRIIHSSQVTIVVDNVDRAASNDIVYRQLEEAFRRRRSGSVIMVCTKTDIVSDNDEGIEYTLEEQKDLDRVRNSILEIRKSTKRLRKDLIRAFDEGDNEKARSININIILNDQEERKQQRSELEFQVIARNRGVSRAIQEGYRQRTQDPEELPVFCLSNAEYVKHMRGYPAYDPPKLSLEATGVPQFRGHIYGRPGEGKFATLEYWDTTLLSTALNRMDMLAKISRLERKEKILKSCQQARQDARAVVKEKFDGFGVNPFGTIVKKMGKDENKYIQKAEEKCLEKSNMAPQSYGAFMRHDGTYETKKVPAQNWNEEFLVVVRKEMDKIFELVHGRSCHGLQVQITEGISVIMTGLAKILQEDPSAKLGFSGAGEAFQVYLENRTDEIKQQCITMENCLKSYVRDVHVKTTTDGPDNYFTIEMKKVYDKVNKIRKPRKGRGKGLSLHSHRSATFTAAVCKRNGGPFYELRNHVHVDLDAANTKCRKELVNDVDGLFAEIEGDARRALSSKHEETPQRSEWVSEVVSLVEEGRSVILDIKRRLAICKGETKDL